MNVSSRLNPPLMAGRDFPVIQGKVRLVLHNCKNHTDDFVYESHNTATNALADIFAANYGGLVNYNNFADLYKTWLGGVLVFKNALDPTAVNDFGIPDRITNPITAHAGQTPLTSQADDTTRGNPDDAGTVITANTTKLVWEWGTSSGNGQISAVGLTHTDVGSYGAGVLSTAQQSLSPFADVACLSRTYAYGDSADCVLAINGNTAYNFYLSDSTTVKIYATPINQSKFGLQGGSLKPLTAYTQTVTATLPNSYAIQASGGCYYWFDFTNNKLVLFGVPTAQGSTLYRDDISLADGTVTHSSITVTGAKLWKFMTKQSTWAPGSGYGINYLPVPTQAMIIDNHLFVYGAETYDNVADSMYSINLANTTDIAQVDNTDFPLFSAEDWADAWTMTNGKHTVLGGLIVNDSFIVNGNKVYPMVRSTTNYNVNRNYTFCDKVSSPVFGCNSSMNNVAVCKMFLGTKFLLDTPVTKSSAQSMTISYELTQS